MAAQHGTRLALPTVFCWTRFGPEAGETFDSILQRKERERLANSGVFFWGIGNALGPSVEALLAAVPEPEVLFSAIRSRPRAKDVAPSVTMRWMAAEPRDGVRTLLPPAVVVHSGGDTLAGTRPHYALVCHSDEPLALGDLGVLYFGALRNLRAGTPLGASQVTAIVQQDPAAVGQAYVVALRARLVAPYFVTLRDPVPVRPRACTRPRQLRGVLSVAP